MLEVSMRIVIASLLLMVSSVAQSADRTAKIQALMEAQGLVAGFQQQMALGRENCRKQADQMLTQLLSSLNAPQGFRDRMNDASKNFIESLQAPWSAEEVVDEWASLYGPNFTDQELDQLLAYYESPLAQKEVKVSRDIYPPFSSHFQDLYKPVIEHATANFVAQLQLIAKECRCAKKTAKKS
jgi:hypothetical protein